VFRTRDVALDVALFQSFILYFPLNFILGFLIISSFSNTVSFLDFRGAKDVLWVKFYLKEMFYNESRLSNFFLRDC
jgi:hypothetical protein